MGETCAVECFVLVGNYTQSRVHTYVKEAKFKEVHPALTMESGEVCDVP